MCGLLRACQRPRGGGFGFDAFFATAVGAAFAAPAARNSRKSNMNCM